MRRACSVGTDDAELHVSWYGCYLTGQGGRSARLPFRRVSRGLGVRPTIVGLVCLWSYLFRTPIRYRSSAVYGREV